MHSYFGCINYIKYFIIDSYTDECNQPNWYICNIHLYVVTSNVIEYYYY